MKRLLSLLLVCTLLFSVIPAVRAVEPETEDGPTPQSAILDLTLEDTTATVNLAAAEDGQIAVAMYTENGAMIGLGLEAVSASAEPQNVAVDLLLWWTRPQYFELRAFLLDNSFAAQCESLTCLAYTSAYEAFIGKTTADFPDRIIMQATEETDNNFMVLSEDVIQLFAGTDFDTLTVQEDETAYTLSGAGSAALAMKTGDCVVLMDHDQQTYSVKVRQAAKSGNTVTVTASDDSTLSDFMDYIKMDLTLDAADLANQASGQASLSADLFGEPEGVLEKHFLTSGVYEINEKLSLECALDVVSSVHVVFHYSEEGFDEDYLYEKTTTEMEAALDIKLVGSVDNSTSSIDEREIPLTVPLSIPIGPSGLTFDLSLGVILSAKVEGSFGFSSRTGYAATVIYDPDGNGQTYQSIIIDDTGFTADAAAEGKVGIRATIGLSFLKAASVQVRPEFGALLRIEMDETAGDPAYTPRHMCRICFDGDLTPYGKISVRGILRMPKLTITLFEVSKEVRQDIDAFYLSYQENGRIVFGWGDCTNFAYAVTLLIQDGNSGEPLPGASVEVYPLSGAGFWSGTSGITLYLKEGPYLAEVSCSEYPDKTEEFTVAGSGNQTVLLYKEEDPDAPPPGLTQMPEACDNYATLIESSSSLHSGHVTMYSSGLVLFTDSSSQKLLCPRGKAHGSAITLSMPWRQSYNQNDPDKLNAIRYASYQEASQTEVGKLVYMAPHLETVSIAPWYTTIRNGAFVDCPSLTTVHGLESITTIGRNAFLGTGLTSVNVTGATSIGSGAFQLCPDLTTVRLGSGSVGQYALAGNPKLTSVSLGNVTQLGLDVFKDCSGLRSISLPGSLSYMEGGDFKNCTALESVEFSEGLTYMGGHVFENCASLNHVILPDSLTSLQTGTFLNCTSLEYVSLGAMSTTGSGAFENCYALERVDFRGPVETLGYRTFYNCQSLSNVTLPDGLKTIDRYAFSNCSNLTELHLPNTLEAIRDYAFENCTALREIYFDGTEEQWAAVSKFNRTNRILSQIPIHFAE